jgi:conjugative transposon TraJ protein
MTDLHSILSTLYDEMLPLCGNLTRLARAIAGIGAVFYIGSRVWRHLASNEPIDFYPLFRPFVIGFVILIFPQFLGAINGIMSPTVTATAGMVDNQNAQIVEFRRQKDLIEEQTLINNPETGWLVDEQQFEDKLDKLNTLDLGAKAGMYIERSEYNLKKTIRNWFREILEIIYQGASLIIDTIRTFFLIVLAIIGPIAFGISVFDGLQVSLMNWVARYLNVFLWLPVANIFGTIIGRLNVLMLQKDIQDLQNGGTFDSTDASYLIFMLIGIVGYTCVPTVSNWIVQSCGGGAYTRRLSATGGGFSNAALSRATNGTENLLNTPQYIQEGYNSKNLNN